MKRIVEKIIKTRKKEKKRKFIIQKHEILYQYSTIYGIPIHIRRLLQVYTKEVTTGSGATASSNRGSDKGPVWTESPATATFSSSVTLRDFLSLFAAGRLLFSLAVVSLADFSSALQLPSLAIVTVIVCGCLKLLFRDFFSFLCDESWERRHVFLEYGGEAVKKH